MMSDRSGSPIMVISAIEATPTICLNLLVRGSQSEGSWLKGGGAKIACTEYTE